MRLNRRLYQVSESRLVTFKEYLSLSVEVAFARVACFAMRICFAISALSLADLPVVSIDLPCLRRGVLDSSAIIYSKMTVESSALLI